MRNKIAIVTGASRAGGIGAAICRELAKKGNDIFFTYFTPYDYLSGYQDASCTWPDEFKQELSELGVRAEGVELDLSDPLAPFRLLEQAGNQLGVPSILINNATHCAEVNFQKLTNEILDDHYAVNVRGTCMLSVEFAKRLVGKTGGRIINLISGQDKGPMPGNLAYVTTKGAISAFTVSLAAELAPHQITVNAMDPGPTDTGWMDGQLKEYLKPKFPMGRIGTPEDAARLAAFLASDDADWITGQIIHSDGGFWD
ncbi:SDR family oxidoreductase [Peribacillus kribbensis]|uniref:SDR family oxidoreductase n=1 Tax=Peribacillus kribbensis TaxID=356658 RepID=UPI0004064A4C|nr:SDR family oxidoreductase [Peribacillus kribbensis]